MDYISMNESHIAQVAALEAQCFTTPWSEHSVSAELTNPLSLWLVATDGDRVLGYVGSQSVLGEADMMNIAVDPEYRREGIARNLVSKLIELLRANGVYCLTLEVRASNDGAIALYESLGFSQIGRRPNYYHAPKEDALILRKEWEV